MYTYSMGITIDHFFLATLPRAERRKKTLFITAGALLTLELIFVHNLFTNGFFRWHGILLYDCIDLSLLFLCASICGNVAALLVALADFIGNSVLHSEFAYASTIFILTVLVAHLPVINCWYLSKKKSLLTVLLGALCAGSLWSTLLNIIQQQPPRLATCLLAFVNVCIPMCINVSICYGFFNYAPEWLKKMSPTGIYYSHCYRSFRETVSCKVQSRLSMRILLIVIVEACILSLAAVFFANLLMPKINPEIIHSFYGKRLMNFVRSKATLAFDLKMLFLMMNATVPLCLLINHFAQHSIAYPIRLMAKAMEDYTRDTTKQEQNSVLNIHLLPIRNRDEIGDLYNSLKITTRNLSKYIEHIEHERQLENDLEVAKAASKAKTAFLSNMSHEIRTPINAVLGMNEMILRESSDPTVLGYATDIKSASASLLSIVNDILDFSKIEAGKMEIIPVQYELSSLVNDLVNMIQKRAEDKGLALHINVAKDMPHMLFGDDVRIKQVILNILTNAVKYTNQGSVTMNIGWKKAGDEHILLTAQVIDTGIGIKEEDLSKLYSAFERIEEQRNRTVEGTGLGMSIVQQLLSMMGSELSVKSEYGKGSDFSFQVQQKVLNWEPIGDFTEMYKKSIASNSRYRESFHAPQAKILIVDDTKLNLTVIKGLLKQTKIQIDTAESGQETLVLVKKNRYDAIFIDHRMPIMDGIETLHAMTGMEGNLNEGVPCIALTANAIQGAREMYLAEGFTDYLSKPVDGAKLEKMLMTYLPPEKVTPAAATGETGEAGQAAGNSGSGAGSVSSGAASGSGQTAFPPLTGIDLAEALKNCGDEDVLREAMEEFYATIDEKAGLIQQYAAEKDWKNYTVLVHALKSSARLIGAGELSAAARRLEECGNAAEAESQGGGPGDAGSAPAAAIAEIGEKTPGLLAAYRAYRQHLSPLCAASDEASLPLIEEKELAEALIGIREFVTAFDYDSADQIMQMLSSYRLPDREKDRIARLKKALTAVDREGVLKLL